MILAYSLWRKAIAVVALIVGFVFLYEIRIFDSQYGVIQKLFSDSGPPPPGSRIAFSATAYCKGSTTASGVSARTGVAAADPQLLPVGSVVNVAAGVAKYSGVYTIMDTGPQVQGRELDLYIWSCNEALAFGPQVGGCDRPSPGLGPAGELAAPDRSPVPPARGEP
jgi:3D (Asp-Asp-Asp) domain-containing protein